MISTLFPTGHLSYIYVPGIAPGPESSTVSGSLDGVFWMQGLGNPAGGLGEDNGSFAPLRADDRGWIQAAPGYPATIHTSWAADSGIDGCPDSSNADRCLVVLLSDEVDGGGYFATITSRAHQGNYALAQTASAPIILFPIPSPTIVDSVWDVPNLRRNTVRLERPDRGASYGVARDCPTEIALGFKIYSRRVPRDSVPVLDRRRDENWSVADGGADNGQPLTFDATPTIRIPCEVDKDVYLAASVVFDSGFETTHLSADSARVPCHE